VQVSALALRSALAGDIVFKVKGIGRDTDVHLVVEFPGRCQG
jgi:hypothetical protein